MTDEYIVLAASALVVAAVLIWNQIRVGERIGTVETQLKEMEKDLNALDTSRRMMMKVKANSKAEVNVVKPTTPAPTTPDQPESASFGRLLEWERQRLRSRWKRIIVSGTIAAAVFAVALAGGYVLLTLIPGTAVVAVKKDDDMSTGAAAVKEDNNTSTSVAAAKKDADHNAGGPTETEAVQLSAPTNTTGQDGPQDGHKGAEVPTGAIAPSPAATNSGDAEVVADRGRALRLPSSERGKQLFTASGHDSSCLPSASAVRQNHPGAWPSFTLRAPGHEGTRCWYAATRDTAHNSRRETPRRERIPTTEEVDSPFR
jgi:hypothetical protein